MKKPLLIVPFVFLLVGIMASQVTQTGCSKLSSTTPVTQLLLTANAEHDPTFVNHFPNSSNLHGVATGVYNFDPNPLPPPTNSASSLQGQCI